MDNSEEVRATPSSTSTRRLLKAAPYLTVVLLFTVLAGAYYRRNTGFTTLINFGEQFEATRLPAVLDAPHFVHIQSPGYDGQWYAQLAVEPLLRNPALYTALDTAPYRARRIFFSWTAYVFGLGRPDWVLKVYAAQNIVAWFLLAWLLLRWLPATGWRNFAAWAGCLFGVGLIGSVRFALLEGPGLLVMALAMLAMERNRPWVASALMAVVGLGRETNLASAGLLVDRIPRTVREAAVIAGRLALAAVPFVLWALYVRSVYPGFSFSNPDSFAWPFSGFVVKWQDSVVGLWHYGWYGEGFYRFRLFSTIGLTVQAGYLLMRRDWRSPWWRAGAAYVLLMPFLSTPVWEGAPGAVTRVVLPMSVAFNILVVRSRWFWPLFVLGNLAILHSLHMMEMPWLWNYV